jgi:hypothetical protein
MSWIDRAKKAVNDVAASANTEGKILKLQAEMAGLEGDRDHQLLEAGKRARELYRARQILDNDMGIVLKRVDDIDAAIDQLRDEVVRIRGEKPSGTPT